jgi:hypothetical protein
VGPPGALWLPGPARELGEHAAGNRSGCVTLRSGAVPEC